MIMSRALNSDVQPTSSRTMRPKAEPQVLDRGEAFQPLILVLTGVVVAILVAVAIAYGLIPVAVALRWAGSAFPASFYLPGMIGAGLVWCLAFALYLGALGPIFFAPRPDGGAA